MTQSFRVKKKDWRRRRRRRRTKRRWSGTEKGDPCRGSSGRWGTMPATREGTAGGAWADRKWNMNG
jgi:hypothetical protein